VRVADEGAVVGRRVLRPRPRLAVVRVAGGRHRAPPGVDRLARRRDEREMEVPRDRPPGFGGPDREVVPLVEAVATIGLAVAEPRERELVEPERSLDLRDANRDVVEDVLHVTILAATV